MTTENCYICLEAETNEGEVCQRACDFCRGSNVHFSCLHEFHKVKGALNTECSVAIECRIIK